MEGKILPPPAPVSGWRKVWANRHFHDTLTVCVSYGITILTVKLHPMSEMQFEGGAPSAGVTLGMLALFTATHGVGASAFYGFFLKGVMPKQGAGAGAALNAIGCFILGHMSLWYGGPTIALVALTWTPAPLMAFIHVALSPGTRLWRCLAYGAAFFSLLLLVLMTGGLRPDTPLWLVAVAVAYQIVLLRLQSRFVARLLLPPA